MLANENQCRSGATKKSHISVSFRECLRDLEDLENALFSKRESSEQSSASISRIVASTCRHLVRVNNISVDLISDTQHATRFINVCRDSMDLLGGLMAFRTFSKFWFAPTKADNRTEALLMNQIVFKCLSDLRKLRLSLELLLNNQASEQS